MRRKIIVNTKSGEMTVNEIADKIGRSPSYVRVLLKRGKDSDYILSIQPNPYTVTRSNLKAMPRYTEQEKRDWFRSRYCKNQTIDYKTHEWRDNIKELTHVASDMFLLNKSDAKALLLRLRREMYGF